MKITELSDSQLIVKMTNIRNEISRRQVEDTRKKNASLVGLYFKYRNCYSCPRSEADYWWIYGHVSALDGYGNLAGCIFQKDTQGKIEIGPWAVPSCDGWIEIAEEEFRSAFRSVIDSAKTLFIKAQLT